jgi:hypothetical protein
MMPAYLDEVPVVAVQELCPNTLIHLLLRGIPLTTFKGTDLIV